MHAKVDVGFVEEPDIFLIEAADGDEVFPARREIRAGEAEEPLIVERELRRVVKLSGSRGVSISTQALMKGACSTSPQGGVT